MARHPLYRRPARDDESLFLSRNDESRRGTFFYNELSMENALRYYKTERSPLPVDEGKVVPLLEQVAQSFKTVADLATKDDCCSDGGERKLKNQGGHREGSRCYVS